jgi:hypothetical protein
MVRIARAMKIRMAQGRFSLTMTVRIAIHLVRLAGITAISVVIRIAGRIQGRSSVRNTVRIAG